MTGQLANGPDLNTEIDPTSFSWVADRHFCALCALTGLCLDPYDFPRSVLGLDGYLQPLMGSQTGPQEDTNFHGVEFVKPANMDIAAKVYPEAYHDALHGPVLLPARFAWPRIGLLALFAQRARAAAREPVSIRYLWRPVPFNKAVNGAPQSDHISACAMDVSFPSAKSWSRILHMVLEPAWKANLLMMSLGWNSGLSYKFHVGFFAPRTVLRGEQRRWDYKH